MASNASISFSLIIFLIITFFLTITITATTQTIRKESRLHFFVQEKTKSPNATVIKVVSGPSNEFNKFFNFGDMFVFDDLITEGPDPKSRPLGRLQGLYTVSSLNGYDGLISLNLVFDNLSPWSGSSLALFGRIQLQEVTSELPVVGGTGQFRLAQGYVLEKQTFLDNISGDSTYELEVIVLHI